MSNPYDPQDPRQGEGAPPPPQAPSWPPAPDQGQSHDRTQDRTQDRAQDQSPYGEPTQQLPTSGGAATQPMPSSGYGASAAGGNDQGGYDQRGYGAPPPAGYGPAAGGYGATPPSGYGAPQPGYGPPAGGYGSTPGGPGQQGTNGLAVASLISGVLGFLCLTAVAAVVLGIVALGQIRRTGKKGRGLAITGIVLGALWLLAGALAIPAALSLFDDDGTVTSTPSATSEAPAPTATSETTSPSPTATATQEPTTTGPGETSVIVAAGDCIDDPAILDGGDVPQSAVVDCSTPHYAEAYAEFDLPEGAYPGDEAVAAAAEEGCDAEFEPFVGLPYDESVFEVFYYYPTTEAWDVDRGVVCVLIDPSGEPVTGSLQGAGR